LDFDTTGLWEFVVSGLRDFTAAQRESLWHPYSVLWAVVVTANVPNILNESRVRHLYDLSRIDRATFWIFMLELCQTGANVVPEKIFVDLLRQENPLTDRAVEFLLFVYESAGPSNTDYFLLMLEKAVEDDRSMATFETSLTKYAEAHDVASIAAPFFRRRLDEGDERVLRLFLEFLDVTEGHVALSNLPDVIPRHHYSRKLRRIVVLRNGEELSLLVHPETCWTAVRNFLAGLDELGLNEIDIDSEVRDGMICRIRHLPSKRDVLKINAFLSRRISPKGLVRHLSNRSIAGLVYKILGRLVPVPTSRLPATLSDFALLYWSQLLPDDLDGSLVMELIEQHTHYDARYLRNCFRWLARRPGWRAPRQFVGLLQQKFLANPKYPETLELYQLCQVSEDQTFLLQSLEFVSECTFPALLSILQKRNFRQDVATAVLLDPLRFARVEPFSHDIFTQCVSNRDAFRGLCDECLQEGAPLKAICCDAVQVAGSSINGIVPILFDGVIDSLDITYQRSAYRLLLASGHLPECEERLSSLMQERDMDQTHSRRFRHYCGLVNLGATCYLNSVLQQLCANSLFLTTFLNSQVERADHEELQNVLFGMKFGGENRFDLSSWVEVWQEYHPSFMTHEQQDAVEFFQKLVGEFPSQVVSLFEGKTVTEYRRTDGSPLTSVRESFIPLHLDVLHSRNLIESIQNACQRETLRGENQFLDVRSHEWVDAISSRRFEEAPPILVLHLKRFEYHARWQERIKRDDRFEFEPSFKLPGPNVDYSLTGIVLHYGTADGGHYYSIVHSAIDDSWLELNDSEVRPIEWERVIQRSFGGTSRDSNAYLLFYSRSDIQTDAPPRPRDLPTSYRQTLDIEDITKFQGLGTQPTVDFVKKMSSPELKTHFFLAVLCHSSNKSLAESFASEVRDLGHVVDFGAVLAIFDENEELGDVLIRILQAGISPHFFDRVPSLAPRIIQKRTTVEWLGRLANTIGGFDILPVVNMLRNLYQKFPHREDDVSGYLKALAHGPSKKRVSGSLLEFGDWIAANPRNIEPFVELLFMARYSWDDIYQNCTNEQVHFFIAFSDCSMQPPARLDLGTLAFLQFCVQPDRLPLLYNAFLRRPAVSLFPLLCSQVKEVRKQTLAIAKSPQCQSPGILDNLIGCVAEIRPITRDPGVYVQLFRLIDWLAEDLRIDLGRSRDVFVRAQQIISRANATWNRSEVELNRLLIRRIRGLAPKCVRDLFRSVFAQVQRWPLKRIEKTSALFVELIETMQTGDKQEFRQIVEGQELFGIWARGAELEQPDQFPAISKLLELAGR
jgi:ubiquitin C-terminal hydrolase